MKVGSTSCLSRQFSLSAFRLCSIFDYGPVVVICIKKEISHQSPPNRLTSAEVYFNLCAEHCEHNYLLNALELLEANQQIHPLGAIMI